MSFPGRFVDTSAGRVFVHRSGEHAGHPPLVLLHGFMMSHWIFRSVLPALSRERDVIAIDLPGFGESDRPSPERYAYDGAAFARTLVEVLDALGVTRADLIGHSLGGQVALMVAARQPARVDRLVLACPAVYPLPRYPEHRLIQSRVGAFVWKHVMGKRDMARSWRTRHVRDPRSIPDELVDYVWERLNRAGGREAALAAGLALGKLRDNSADPGRVRAPTLLLWPEEDRVVPLQHGKRLSRVIPGARLAVIPACGHELFVERPNEALRELRAFLHARVEAVPPAARGVEEAMAPVPAEVAEAKRSAS